MFHRYAYWKRRKRPGATLVEMLIALIILAVMLFSIMAVMVMTASSTVATKETQDAYLNGLSRMELLESRKDAKSITGGQVSYFTSADLGSYTMQSDVSSDVLYTAPTPANSIVSADITVKAEWNGAKKMQPIIFVRQVSPSAWQNAGEMPEK